MQNQMASKRWTAFALLVAAYFITIVDFTIVNVALPTIGRELRFPESNLQWVVTAYGLTYAGFVLLGGRAVDRDEHVRGGSRAQQGPRHLGQGRRTWRDGRPAGRRHPHHLRRMTVHLLLQRARRRGGARPSPRLVPASRGRSGPRRYDTRGALSISAALLAGVYAISEAPQVGWAAPKTVALLAASAVLAALFLAVETRAEAPLLPLRLLRLSSVAGSNAVGFLLGTSWTTFIPVSIGALAGVAPRDAGVASGLLSTSQNLGGAIGVAVASSIAASHFHTLAHHGYATAAALTGGFQWAMWLCGLTGLAAVPVAFALIRYRTRKARETATAEPEGLALAAR